VLAALVEPPHVLDDAVRDAEVAGRRARRDAAVDVNREHRVDGVVVDAEFLLVGLVGPQLRRRRLRHEVLGDVQLPGELANLHLVEVADWVAVDGTVAVLGEVARECLRPVSGSEHDAGLVVRDEVVEHAAGACAGVPDRELVALCVGVELSQ